MYLNYEVITKGIVFQVIEKEQVFAQLSKDKSKIKHFKRNLNNVTDLSSFDRHCNVSSAMAAEATVQNTIIKLIMRLFNEDKGYSRDLLKSKYITVAFSHWTSPLTEKTFVYAYFYAMKKPFIENRNAMIDSYI